MIHKVRILLVAVFPVLIFACTTTSHPSVETTGDEISVWQTTGDKRSLFEQKQGLSFTPDSGASAVIVVDTATKFQSIDGFGYSLTGGSAYVINEKLDPSEREALLKELFLAEGNGIGVSYLRVSIGASDLDDHVFSYCDIPAGKTDPQLTSFSLKEDKKKSYPCVEGDPGP